MMNTMMDKFFAKMTKQEKQELMATMMPKMMEKMLEDMTSEEKQELMMTMMPMMMQNMFGGGDGSNSEGPNMMMTMMSQMFGGSGTQSKTKSNNKATKKGQNKNNHKPISEPTADNPMKDMMQMCMGEGEHKPPWISMEKAFQMAMNATEYSMLSTDEINNLFQDWMKETNNKILSLIKETTDPKELAEMLNISEKSVYYILCKLAQDKKFKLKVMV
jgi:L-rhamnose mutarotase